MLEGHSRADQLQSNSDDILGCKRPTIALAWDVGAEAIVNGRGCAQQKHFGIMTICFASFRSFGSRNRNIFWILRSLDICEITLEFLKFDTLNWTSHECIFLSAASVGKCLCKFLAFTTLDASVVAIPQDGNVGP